MLQHLTDSDDIKLPFRKCSSFSYSEVPPPPTCVSKTVLTSLRDGVPGALGSPAFPGTRVLPSEGLLCLVQHIACLAEVWAEGQIPQACWAWRGGVWVSLRMLTSSESIPLSVALVTPFDHYFLTSLRVGSEKGSPFPSCSLPCAVLHWYRFRVRCSTHSLPWYQTQIALCRLRWEMNF